MKIIDSHCHLNSATLSNNIDKILKRAEDAGVSHIINICTTLEEADSVYEMASLHKQIYASCGVHPHDASPTLNNYGEEQLYNTLTHLAHRPKIVGLGEAGLDYHYNNSKDTDQKKVFEIHLQTAQETNLPLIIHTRDAEDDTIAMLRSYDGIRGVLHCFTGSYNLAKKALDLGFYISASGIITFKNTFELRDVFSKLPLDRILIETDAPFLAPIPYRGKDNEPSYIFKTLEMLAITLGVEENLLAEQTRINTLNLFSRIDN